MKQTSHFGYKSGLKYPVYPVNNYLNNTTKPTQCNNFNNNISHKKNPALYKQRLKEKGDI